MHTLLFTRLSTRPGQLWDVQLEEILVQNLMQKLLVLGWLSADEIGTKVVHISYHAQTFLDGLSDFVSKDSNIPY